MLEKCENPLHCQSCIFVQNYRYLFLDEVSCIYCATHYVNFLVLLFVQLKLKSKMAARYFFSADQLAKEVPPGTCFLGPVQYGRTFLGRMQCNRSFHGKHSKLMNMGKHPMFSAMQSEWDNFLGI